MVSAFISACKGQHFLFILFFQQNLILNVEEKQDNSNNLLIISDEEAWEHSWKVRSNNFKLVKNLQSKSELFTGEIYNIRSSTSFSPVNYKELKWQIIVTVFPKIFWKYLL